MLDACADSLALFARVVDDADNLYFVMLGGTAKHDPATLRALGRAAIVLTLASWEAFVERLPRNLVAATLEIPPPEGIAFPSTGSAFQKMLAMKHELLARSVSDACSRLNTPDPGNVITLFRAVGVGLNWEISAGMLQTTPAQTRGMLEGWLKVRHAVAHGGTITAQANSPVELVRVGGDPTVADTDVLACVRFFKALTAVVAAQSREQFSQQAIA